MKPYTKVTVPGYSSHSFTPAEMAVIVAAFGQDGFVSLDHHAAARVVYMAKRYLAAWLGRAFFAQERKGFTDKRLTDVAVKLCRARLFLEPSVRIPDAAALTQSGRLAALAIKEAFDPPLTPEQFKDARAGSMFARTGRFAA